MGPSTRLRLLPHKGRAPSIVFGPLLALGFAAPGCLDPEPPILFVPLDAGATTIDPFDVITGSLEQLGYSVIRVDRAARVVLSDWKDGNSYAGATRTRVEVRIQVPEGLQAGAVPGFVVAVPRELLAGDRWMLYGEDEEVRRALVGTLLARMQAARRR